MTETGDTDETADTGGRDNTDETATTDGRDDRSGPQVSARDAIAYASDVEFLSLFGVFLVGWVLWALGAGFLTSSLPTGIQLLFGVPLVVLGVLVVFVGIVAVARKLLVEST